MSIYGAAGFPLRDGIPRGSIFVDFLRSQGNGAPPRPSTTPAAPASSAEVPGGFDDAATETTLSRKNTPQAGGVVRTDAVKQFSDGSRRTEVWHKHPDGTFDIATERRSLPDAEGFEKVRVWAQRTAPDGSKSGEFRMFRVPAGMQMDWDSAGAQQFLSVSTQKKLAPDGTIVPDLMARVSGGVPDIAGRTREDVAAKPERRPTIPLPS